MNIFLLSMIVLLAGGILPLVTCRRFLLTKWIYSAVTISGSAIGLYSLAVMAEQSSNPTQSHLWLNSFQITLALDPLSIFFLVPILIICPLAALFSFHYLDNPGQGGKTAVSFLFFNLLMVSMAMVALAANMITFALAWEMMSVSSYFLVMFDADKEETRQAGYLYFLFTQAGALLIFASFALIFRYSGDFGFTTAAAIPEQTKILVFFLALLGFGSKAGVFPVHIWLPHAHPAAPSHVSAVMSGVMIKMGIYGILRFYFLLSPDSILLGQTVLLLGMISGVLGVVYALGKHDIKRLLAYHSVENIGIILIGAGLGMIGITAGNPIMAGFGFAGCLLHVLNHSIFKSLLFFGAGGVVQATGTRHVDQLGGLMRRMPTTGKSFLVGSIAISGLPPFNGFVSEFLIYFAAFHGLILGSSSLILVILSIISLAVIGGLASACFTKVVGIVFLGEPRSDKAAGAGEAGIAMTLPMGILAGICLLIGIVPGPFINLVFRALPPLPTLTALDPGLIAAVAGNLALAARLILIILLLVTLARKALYQRKEVAHGPTWGCGFTQGNTRMQYTGTSYARSMVEFYRPFTQIQTRYTGIGRIFPGTTTYDSRVDDIAEIGLYKFLIGPLAGLLRRLRWIQHGNIHLYFSYIILTIFVLLLMV